MRTATAILFFSLALPAGASPVRHTFRESIPRGQVRRIVIDIPAGDVEIRNGVSDRVTVTGWVSRDPDSDRSRDKQQRIVDDSSVEIYVSRDEAVVRRHFGPEARGWRGSMFSNYHVNVELPAGTDIEVGTRFGDLTIEGSFGDIDVDLRAGDVNVRIPKKDVRELNASARIGEVRAKLGDEVVSREGVFPGKTRYVNRSGRTVVNLHVTAGDLNVDLQQ